MSSVKGQEKHSYTGASSCERWVNCPASVQLHKRVGDSPSNFYAAEGTRAHAMAEYALNYYNSVRKSGYMQGWLGKIEKVEGYEIPTTQEMIDGVRLYVDTICEDMYYDGLTYETDDGLDYPKLQELFVEQHVDLGFGDCFGTVDAAYMVDDVLNIYDLKFGKGIDVSPVENYQAMFYALGMTRYILTEYGDFISAVNIKIIQPRSPLGLPIKSWTTTRKALENFEQKLIDAVELVESDNPSYCANEKWCRWCPGKLVCPELRNTIHKTAKTDFCHLIEQKQQEDLLDVKRMTNIELGALLSNEKLIKNFLEYGKEEAFDRLAKGEEIPGFGLISKLGNRVWKAEAEGRLFSTHGMNIYAPHKMLSPAQLEKELGVKVDELTVRPNTLSVGESKAKHNKTVEQFKQLM
jgi:hypothetical protein